MIDRVKMDLDVKVKNLDGKSDDELLAIVGAYALSEEPVNLTTVRIGGTKGKNLVSYGKAYLKKIEPVLKEAICGNDGLLAQADKIKVADIIPAVLVALGIAAGSLIPTVAVAIAYMIIRATLRVYCKDYAKPQTAKA
jgi:hypothetical protein